MIIEHETEELRKLEMERQRAFFEYKKALKRFNNSPAHRTISDLITKDELEALRKKVRES